MIEASFAKQYGIRLSIEEITVSEYYLLLGGLMHDTPLGAMIEIRSEENKDILKNFTREQHEIRSSWRQQQAQRQFASMTNEEKKEQISQIRSMFQGLAGYTETKKGGG